MARDTECFLKGTQFHLQPLTLALEEGGQSTRAMERKFGVGGYRERAEESAARIHVLSHSLYCRSHFLMQSTPFQVTSSWEEAIAPPAGLHLTLPCRA